MFRLKPVELRDVRSMLQRSEETLQKAKIIVDAAKKNGEFTATQRANLTGLIKKSRTLHARAANTWAWLLSEDGLLRKEHLNAQTRRGAEKAIDMLATIMENHQITLRKRLETNQFEKITFMAHLKADRHFKSLNVPVALAA